MKKTAWLLLSFVLFILSFYWAFSLKVLCLLLLALIFHELGHFVCMKILKYKEIRPIFIPFFGAAVMGEKPKGLSPLKEGLVYLMGPLPGITLGTLLLVFVNYSGYHHNLLDSFIFILLWFNIFNLIPIIPLDGGRYLEIAFLRRYSRVSLLFKIFSVLSILAYAYYFDVYAFYALAALISFNSWASYDDKPEGQIPNFRTTVILVMLYIASFAIPIVALEGPKQLLIYLRVVERPNLLLERWGELPVKSKMEVKRLCKTDAVYEIWFKKKTVTPMFSLDYFSAKDTLGLVSPKFRDDFDLGKPFWFGGSLDSMVSKQMDTVHSEVDWNSRESSIRYQNRMDSLEVFGIEWI